MAQLSSAAAGDVFLYTLPNSSHPASPAVSAEAGGRCITLRRGAARPPWGGASPSGVSCSLSIGDPSWQQHLQNPSLGRRPKKTVFVVIRLLLLLQGSPILPSTTRNFPSPYLPQIRNASMCHHVAARAQLKGRSGTQFTDTAPAGHVYENGDAECVAIVAIASSGSSQQMAEYSCSTTILRQIQYQGDKARSWQRIGRGSRPGIATNLALASVPSLYKQHQINIRITYWNSR